MKFLKLSNMKFSTHISNCMISKRRSAIVGHPHRATTNPQQEYMSDRDRKELCQPVSRVHDDCNHCCKYHEVAA